MLLRYVLNGETEVAEVIRMFHRGNNGYFTCQDGRVLRLAPIETQDWLKLISNMFSDNKLSLPIDKTRELSVELSET